MGIHPLSFSSWYEPSRKVVVENSLKQYAIQNFKAAQRLLNRRLGQGYYRVNVDHLKEKAAEFDSWIKKTKEL
jgi:hypothetical protein